ncbi:DEAD/DEAH box helicase, partial [Arthrobacter sp. H14]|uniref:DEAD/DEAH box helicase n=1 Tax=Arthrobacter sp. H14 TaxID=1312959 RepID=UPI0012DF132B
MTETGTTAEQTTDPEADGHLRVRATELLRKLVGSETADFHPGQYEAVEALVEGGRRALVVQRTGWGKSAVYFVSSLLMRARGAGPTLIVSPLLALMRDQVAAAERAGVRAVAINSANQHEWEEARQQLAADQVDVLLVSPERLNNPRFREEQLPELISRMGLLVIDEAHCISDWGHDFRPDYRRIRDLINLLPPSVPVLATTATANSRVVRDIEDQLGEEALSIRGQLARASLRLGVLLLPNAKARLGWLLSHLNDLTGSGIIYALTVSGAEDTARLLKEAGHNVLAYTGR